MNINSNYTRTGKETVIQWQTSNGGRAEKEGSNKRSTVYAGNLNVHPDSITLKKKQAQEQAMKVLTDTFNSDKKADQGMDDMSAEMQGLKDANAGYYKELDQIRGEKQELMERYGVTEDSTEYSEEYRQQIQELEERENLYSGYIDENNASIKAISSSINDMRIERLKSDPMVDAGKQSEEILKAANKDVYGELVKEAKNHIEEKAEEEKAEKRDEKEEEDTQETIETLDSYNNPDPEIKKEIDDILDEFKLMQEDLKGAAVDKNI